ncbi:MAG: hypothetical protein Q8N23_35785 [Archangium sp.]|nr:hypothetical protein [Archangium sp.]MDP3158088.1 hypothetical protein [Archangium sp.]MDP3570505.1 hypothetical protein [Archangium sp.]
MLLALLFTATAGLVDGGVEDAVDAGPELHLAVPLPGPDVAPPPPDGPAITATRAPALTPVPMAPAPADAGMEPPSALSLHGAAEAELGLFPAGFPENGFDLMTSLHPVIGFAVGDDFGIDFGPTFRFRLIDTPAFNRPSDVGGFLRGADWDELSDYGQILQSLRIAKETGIFHLRLGPERKKTLGLGHLLWRYNSQANPDYHPASGTAVLRAGPIRADFFASDILGARLFAGAVAWDIGGTFSSDAQVKDRYVLAFELAHDANLAARPFRPDASVAPFTLPAVTLLQLDASAVLVRNAALRWMVMGGVGTRNNLTADLGLVVGMTLDANVKEIGFSTRLELRKQAGGFRHGFFGPTYELQRFVDIGFRGASLGDAVLPDSGSGFAELRVGIGTRVSFDAAAEYFFWNRLDLDGGLSLALLGDWFFLTARTTILGLLQAPRFAFNAGLRWRLFPSFYVVGDGGTVFFPQVDGTLIRGVSFSAGVGVDFER